MRLLPVGFPYVQSSPVRRNGVFNLFSRVSKHMHWYHGRFAVAHARMTQV